MIFFETLTSPLSCYFQVSNLESELKNKNAEMKDVFNALDNHKNSAKELQAKVEQYEQEKKDFAVHMDRYGLQTNSTLVLCFDGLVQIRKIILFID